MACDDIIRNLTEFVYIEWRKKKTPTRINTIKFCCVRERGGGGD